MKRNLDTVRKLLDFAEAQPAGQPLMGFKGDFDNTAVEVVEHIALMIDASLIEGEAHPDTRSSGGGIFVITGVTWKGHDFLDAARSDTVWNATKGRMAKAGAWTVTKSCGDRTDINRFHDE